MSYIFDSFQNTEIQNRMIVYNFINIIFIINKSRINHIFFDNYTYSMFRSFCKSTYNISTVFFKM